MVVVELCDIDIEIVYKHSSFCFQTWYGNDSSSWLCILMPYKHYQDMVETVKSTKRILMTYD